MINAILISLLVILIWWLLIVILTTTLGYYLYGSIYKETYNSLPSKSFYLNKDQVYCHRFDEYLRGSRFVWFIKTNDFTLPKGACLYVAYSPFFYPYQYYWLKKYRKWFKENVDIDNLVKWRDS